MMGRLSNVLFLVILFGSAAFLVSLAPSPRSSIEPITNPSDEPDWLDDVYIHFDSLRTDVSDYQWPTEASQTMSSAFAEFRRTHFHAGIDISTRGTTGYRVFASRDGYVERIHVSPFGYGKMLQVRHEDGFVTVYAHLKRFDDRIDAYVRGFQYANERYSLDVRPEPEAFVVRKGDVIAFTGATGAGPPHLHFEIRDERTNPVNPLLFPHFAAAVTDTRAPEFREISFAPYDHSGRINGTPLPASVDARFLGNGRYVVPRTIRLSGAIGLSVRATDRVNATWHNNGVYQYELFLDSTLIYTSKLDRFSSKLTEQIALHYDWPMVEAGEGRFQRLFLEPGNRLPLYARSPEKSGVIEAAAYENGLHSLIIVARDVQGNQSRLTATVLLDEMPVIDVRKDGNVMVIAPSPRTTVSSITVASRNPGSRAWTRKSYEASDLNVDGDGYIVPVPDGKRLYKVEATTSAGSVSHPVFFSPPTKTSKSTSLSLKKEFVRDYLLVTLSSHLPFTIRPSLRMTSGQKSTILEINATDERRYVGTIPLADLESTTVRLDSWGTVNGTDVEAADEFSLFPIFPASGGLIVAGEGEFEIDFPPNGVYQPLFVRIEETEAGYAAYPQDVLLNKGATVRYRQASGTDEKTGLYFVDDGDVSLISAKYAEGAYAARVTKFLSEFSIRRDTIPPSISSLSVRYSRGILRVRFGLRDYLSGLNADALRITVDDRLLIGELDSDKRLVLFEEPLDLQAGQHLLRIEAHDKAGNVAEAERRFKSY